MPFRDARRSTKVCSKIDTVMNACRTTVIKIFFDPEDDIEEDGDEEEMEVKQVCNILETTSSTALSS